MAKLLETQCGVSLHDRSGGSPLGVLGFTPTSTEYEQISRFKMLCTTGIKTPHWNTEFTPPVGVNNPSGLIINPLWGFYSHLVVMRIILS